jgi:molybdopterin/thiamine biosynthesis adenylyltransferase
MVEPPKIVKDASLLPPDTHVVDALASMLGELFSVRNPSAPKDAAQTETEKERFVRDWKGGECAVYFPWRSTAVRMLPEREYFELRTARNRNLITTEEQQRFRDASVGVAGLSVGSSVVHALAMSGGPKKLKIADFDAVAATNLNRLRAGLPDIGTPKADVAAKLVWELDPFADIECFERGIDDSTLEAFAAGSEPDVIVDEMESIKEKVRLRIIAKRERKPVIMATDNGNGIILDIERFDLEPDRPLFHGNLSLDPSELDTLGYREWLSLATQIVGPEYPDDRMRSSILEIGKTIPSVPQLGISALFAGVAVCFAAREIIAGGSCPSGRYEYALESLIDSSYTSPDRKAARSASAADFLSQLAQK